MDDKKGFNSVLSDYFWWLLVVVFLPGCNSTLTNPSPISVLSSDEEAKATSPGVEHSAETGAVQEDEGVGEEFISIGPADRRWVGDTTPPQRAVAPSERIDREEDVDMSDGESSAPRPRESSDSRFDGMSENRAYGSLPCGDNTIATIIAGNGNQLSFCNVGDEGVMISEIGKLDTSLWAGTRTALPSQFSCAAEVFAAVAPAGAPIPEKLVELCEKRQGKSIHFSEEKIARKVIGKHAHLDDKNAVSPPSFFSHFCSANGRSNFREEKCSKVEDHHANAYLGVSWCRSNSYTWHQRTMSTQLGTKGDHGFEVIASCQGSTDHKGGWFNNVPNIDSVVRVKPGYWHSYIYENHQILDYDIRFSAEGVGDRAWYRYAGHFVDYSWP